MPAFIITLKLKPMLCWYMFNSWFSRKGGKKAPTCSNCQFHGEIPLMADFKLPLHHEATEAIHTWAPTSCCKSARARFITPPSELQTFWKYNSKFPQVRVKLTWWCFQRSTSMELQYFNLKYLNQLSSDLTKTLGVFLGFPLQIKQP